MSRRAFTLVELLVVLAILCALAGMGYPALGYFQQRARVQSTTATVQAITAAIETYGQRTWTWRDGTTNHTLALWDCDQNGASGTSDGLLDGDPAREGGSWPAGLIASGYTGFVAMTGFTRASRSVNAKGQAVDAWGRPFCIRYPASGQDFGTVGCRIWSCGRDGRTDTANLYDATKTDNRDDITSWNPQP